MNHWRSILAGALGLLALAGCEDRSTRTRRVVEEYAVVPGTPQVEVGTPGVAEEPAGDTSHFRVNTARQCDAYQQLSVRKVDILWVVDDSGSMAPKQARLAANFQGFIQQLVSANPPIDFHIAVASTDTDAADRRGRLRPWTKGPLTGDFIGCEPDVTGATGCNVGTPADAVAAFQQMVNVGTSGSAVERGLYATYLALEEPSNSGPDRFVRPDAALYVVVVSDEDDGSCFPVARQPVCTMDPGCRCAPDAALGGTGAWGSTAWFTRFLETYKGHGREELVAFAAITALQGDPDAGVPSQFGDPSAHVGCCRTTTGEPCPTSGVNDGGFEVAYHGARYLQVAAATGGVSVDICSDDFQGALSALGYAASGLRKEFRLSRAPDLRAGSGALEVYVSAPTAANCQVDGNCPQGEACRLGRCARRLPVTTSAAPDGARYVRCENAALRNSVRFDGAAIPESLSAVEICYDVLSENPQSCQQ
ncbi:MAG: hypothetical protein RL653_209 [Pseudomonadota bacterium]